MLWNPQGKGLVNANFSERSTLEVSFCWLHSATRSGFPKSWGLRPCHVPPRLVLWIRTHRDWSRHLASLQIRLENSVCLKPSLGKTQEHGDRVWACWNLQKRLRDVGNTPAAVPVRGGAGSVPVHGGTTGTAGDSWLPGFQAVLQPEVWQYTGAGQQVTMRACSYLCHLCIICGLLFPSFSPQFWPSTPQGRVWSSSPSSPPRVPLFTPATTPGLLTINISD